MSSAVPVLIVTGTVGVGKSAVVIEMHHVLEKLDVPHACIDVDWLRTSWPPSGHYNEDVAFQNIESVCSNFRANGAERFVIADVVEERGQLAKFERAIPGAEITICRLTAPPAIRESRLRSREAGVRLDWHLDRSVELDAILDAAQVADVTVDNGDRPIVEVAAEVLERCRWTSRA